MPSSTLTSKGQITLPKEIRDYLNLRTGQKVDFTVDASGKVLLRPRQRDIRVLKGLLRARRKRPVSLQEMNEAIAQGWAGE